MIPEFYDVVRESLETKGSRACVNEIEKATRAVSDLIRSRKSVEMTTLKNLFRFENDYERSSTKHVTHHLPI